MGGSSSAIEEREFRSFLDFLFFCLFLLKEAEETEPESPLVSLPGGSVSGLTWSGPGPDWSRRAFWPIMTSSIRLICVILASNFLSIWISRRLSMISSTCWRASSLRMAGSGPSPHRGEGCSIITRLPGVAWGRGSGATVIGVIKYEPLARPRALPEGFLPALAEKTGPVLPSCMAGRDVLTSRDCPTDPGLRNYPGH